jgi:hypothetical protein
MQQSSDIILGKQNLEAKQWRPDHPPVRQFIVERSL